MVASDKRFRINGRPGGPPPPPRSRFLRQRAQVPAARGPGRPRGCRSGSGRRRCLSRAFQFFWGGVGGICLSHPCCSFLCPGGKRVCNMKPKKHREETGGVVCRIPVAPSCLGVEGVLGAQVKGRCWMGETASSKGEVASCFAPLGSRVWYSGLQLLPLLLGAFGSRVQVPWFRGPPVASFRCSLPPRGPMRSAPLGGWPLSPRGPMHSQCSVSLLPPPCWLLPPLVAPSTLCTSRGQPSGKNGRGVLGMSSVGRVPGVSSGGEGAGKGRW